MNKFKIGDPVMIHQDSIMTNIDMVTDQLGITREQAATLIPPRSYVGTVTDVIAPFDARTQDGYEVKWDHLGEAGGPYMFYENELRSGS
jgi:hypothetical protein